VLVEQRGCHLPGHPHPQRRPHLLELSQVYLVAGAQGSRFLLQDLREGGRDTANTPGSLIVVRCESSAGQQRGDCSKWTMLAGTKNSIPFSGRTERRNPPLPQFPPHPSHTCVYIHSPCQRL
jgi:hypothetical protein